ncbi:hypothetical protein STEG23_016078 [Scotinomys teguina]
MASQLPEEAVESQVSDELECKICYNRYNLKQRKPKVLECCHRVCAKCLYKIIDFGDSPQGVIVCPFCRFETCLPDDEVSSLPDDNNILVNLTCGSKGKKCLPENPTELLLTPKRLASLVSPSHTSSNCLVITIMEVQRESSPSLSSTPVVEFYRPASFDSVTPVSHNWTGEDPIWVPRRLTRILKDASMDDDVPAEPADVLDEPTAGEDGAKMGDPVSVSEFDASPA